jgi:hypothetical protein
MHVRQFRDAAGVEWKVSMTTRSSPAVSRDHYLPESYREGWLLFESENEKRRLAPVPRDWESLSDEALAMLCARAPQQTARPRPPSEAAAAAAAPTRDEPLRPKLTDIEKQLDKTIDEVCEAPSAANLDTGELIRVEETLALAAEAAKEAVSLRRRMRVDRQRDAERSPTGSEGAPTDDHTSGRRDDGSSPNP